MPQALGDEGLRSHQLVDSFLRRLWTEEEYSNVKLIEPLVATFQDESGKLWKPGYKYAVLSRRKLHILSNPASQPKDVELSVDIACIKEIRIVSLLP